MRSFGLMRDNSIQEALMRRIDCLAFLGALFSIVAVLTIIFVFLLPLHQKVSFIKDGCRGATAISEQEIVQLAIDNSLKMNRAFHESSSERTSPSLHERKEDFLMRNPSCCKVISWPKKWVERMFYPNLTKIVEITYQLELGDQANGMSGRVVTEWHEFSYCGIKLG